MHSLGAWPGGCPWRGYSPSGGPSCQNSKFLCHQDHITLTNLQSALRHRKYPNRVRWTRSLSRPILLFGWEADDGGTTPILTHYTAIKLDVCWHHYRIIKLFSVTLAIIILKIHLFISRLFLFISTNSRKAFFFSNNLIPKCFCGLPIHLLFPPLFSLFSKRNRDSWPWLVNEMTCIVHSKP